MLNLEIGKRYRVKLFWGGTLEGTVKSKTIHGDDSHSYWLSSWNEKRQLNTGGYIWDKGYANKGRTIVSDEYAINTCEEISKNSNSTHD